MLTVTTAWSEFPRGQCCMARHRVKTEISKRNHHGYWETRWKVNYLCETLIDWNVREKWLILDLGTDLALVNTEYCTPNQIIAGTLQWTDDFFQLWILYMSSICCLGWRFRKEASSWDQPLNVIDENSWPTQCWYYVIRLCKTWLSIVKLHRFLVVTHFVSESVFTSFA